MFIHQSVYSYYFAPKTVTIRPAQGAENPGLTGTLYIGIRAQDLLLRNGNFYTDCGLLLQSDIDALSQQDSAEYTAIILSNTNDAERIDLIEELNFTLIPVDPASTIAPFNTNYPTGIPFSPSIARPQFVDRLKAKQFNFGTDANSVLYKTKQNQTVSKIVDQTVVHLHW